MSQKEQNILILAYGISETHIPETSWTREIHDSKTKISNFIENPFRYGDSFVYKHYEPEIKNGDVIINCIGTIKPRVDELGDLNAIIVNSLFPRLLSNYCESKEIKLIHPTTDCVYTGLKGDYNENDNYDVSDVYGMSKALGETHNCTTIRTSIIGEESVNKRSLVEWVKSEKGNSIFGFTNHYWNGLTCLQFAKVCDKIISENIFWKGIRHIHSNKVSKYELVSIIHHGMKMMYEEQKNLFYYITVMNENYQQPTMPKDWQLDSTIEALDKWLNNGLTVGGGKVRVRVRV